MKHKRQHYIPSSYLQAWCDPQTPRGHKPYVWLFSRDGKDVRKKAPEKVLHEKDLYTVYASDGQRDLTLEYNLSRLEREFSKLRNNKLSKRLPLTAEEHLVLCMFVAAMHGRTKAYGEHWSKQWKRALDFGERIERWMEEASPKEQAQMAAVLSSPHTNDENSMTMDEVRELVEHPIQSSLSMIVTEISPILFRFPFVVLETSSSLEFITSDAPCVWFDPAEFQNPRPFGAGGLASPTIEITLPLSPGQMFFLGKKLLLPGVYIRVEDPILIDTLNKRTRVCSSEYFVFNQPVARQQWF